MVWLSLVSLFVNWLYTKEVPYTIHEWEDMNTFGPYPTQGSRLREFISAYALGDRLLAPAFCHATNNGFDKIFRDYLGCPGKGRRLISVAFSNLPSACILLQNLVDGYCEKWEKGDVDYSLKAQNEFPQDFLRRAMHRLHELSEMTDEEKKQRRCYLEHDSDSGKQLCRRIHMRWDAGEELWLL